MRVCLIRNAEGETNAQLERVASALSVTSNDFFYITRSREANGTRKIIKKNILAGGRKVLNYEIQLPAANGGNIKKVASLLEYNRILKKWLDENHDQFDTIHAIDYDTGQVALKVCKKHNKKFIYHIADLYVDSRLNIPNQLKKILRNAEYNIINQADATIICSEERKEQIKGSHPKKIVVVHNTPARNQFAYKSVNKRSKNNQLVLTYVGGLEKKRFIDKAIVCIEGREDYQLLLAGSLGDARDSFENLDKSNNIRYLGKVSYEKALTLYRETDIMFAVYNPDHPNHKYSAPNKVYEAMLMGKAIIVAKGTGVDKIVEKTNMGYVIDFNEESFSDMLTHISNNKTELSEKSINAFNAYEKYSWNEMKNRIVMLYNDL